VRGLLIQRVLLPKLLYHLIADIAGVAQWRMSTRFTPGGSAATLAAIRGEVVRARTRARIRGNAFLDHHRADLSVAERICLDRLDNRHRGDGGEDP